MTKVFNQIKLWMFWLILFIKIPRPQLKLFKVLQIQILIIQYSKILLVQVRKTKKNK